MKTIKLLFLLLLTPFYNFAQNDCSTAISIESGIVHTVDTLLGTDLPATICTSGGTGFDNTEWYVFSSESIGLLNITTDLPQNEGIDTRFNIYTGDCDNLVCAGGDDDTGSGFLSIASIYVLPDVDYYIVFDDRWDASGFDFELELLDPGDGILFNPTITGISGNARCVVDMNGDFLDDIVGVSGDDLIIRYQQNDGTFIQETIVVPDVEFSPSWSIAAGDIDGNGYNDLIYGNGVGVSFVYANDDGTAYSEVHTDEYVFCQRTNFVDINNDGHLDAFVCHDVEPNVYYLNDGEGNLSFNQGGLGDTPDGGNYGSVWVDFDNNGTVDLFIAKCRGGDSDAKINQLHRNDGFGNFVEIAEEIGLMDEVQTWSSAWADYDNDGDMDAFIGASSFANGTHRLMLNNGVGEFTNIATSVGLDEYTDLGIENAPYDFDNDGFVDVITDNFHLLKNNGDLSFTANSVPFGKAAVGDLNNDGFLDVLSNGVVFLNSGNENNFITINTIGVESNVNGIGSKIIIESALGSQIREVRSGESFAVMSTLNTHFGIGTDTEITSITVQWPSGIVDVIYNPTINSTVTIVEGTYTGIQENSISQVSIYPNPATDYITLSSIENSKLTSLEIHDLSGKLVATPNPTNNKIDIRSLANGTYFLNASIDGVVDVVKFVKE